LSELSKQVENMTYMLTMIELIDCIWE